MEQREKTKVILPAMFNGFYISFIVALYNTVIGGMTACTMAFMEEWSEFFYAMTLTDQMTLPPTRAGFQRIEQINWNTLAAAVVIPPSLPLYFRNILYRD